MARMPERLGPGRPVRHAQLTREANAWERGREEKEVVRRVGGRKGDEWQKWEKSEVGRIGGRERE